MQKNILQFSREQHSYWNRVCLRPVSIFEAGEHGQVQDSGELHDQDGALGSRHTVPADGSIAPASTRSEVRADFGCLVWDTVRGSIFQIGGK